MVSTSHQLFISTLKNKKQGTFLLANAPNQRPFNERSLMHPKLISLIKQSAAGNWAYCLFRQLCGKSPRPDFLFPNLINIELSSLCNLQCCHCPTHAPQQDLTNQRPLGHIDTTLFNALMDEIDAHGPRNLCLHKDGEPLLHPHILSILARVKQNKDHHVYLTTNGIKLNTALSKAIIDARINHLNISIGAFSSDFYQRVRGGNLQIVKSNIHDFLSLLKNSPFKPKVSVQIIRLTDFDMEAEIASFVKYWKAFDVAIEVWDELSWGIKAIDATPQHRYPCYSLWDSFTINSDGLVSACCMDWNRSLKLGNARTQSIQHIWQDKQIRQFREYHMRCDFKKMPLCNNCNYWHWQPMLLSYKAFER
jgi:radical SAM protein with 4Fe4S-binding SPASM domain